MVSASWHGSGSGKRGRRGVDDEDPKEKERKGPSSKNKKAPVRVVPGEKQIQSDGWGRGAENERTITTTIQPRFVALRFREPAIRPADRYIEDEVKLLVEGRRVRAASPRVRQGYEAGTVADDWGEVAAFEEGLVEAQIEKRVQARVHVDSTVTGANGEGRSVRDSRFAAMDQAKAK